MEYRTECIALNGSLYLNGIAENYYSARKCSKCIYIIYHSLKTYFINNNTRKKKYIINEIKCNKNKLREWNVASWPCQFLCSHFDKWQANTTYWLNRIISSHHHMYNSSNIIITILKLNHTHFYQCNVIYLSEKHRDKSRKIQPAYNFETISSRKKASHFNNK